MYDAFAEARKTTKTELVQLERVTETRWNSHAYALLRFGDVESAASLLCVDRALGLGKFLLQEKEIGYLAVG